jgi:hypothetical protein
VPIGIFLGFHVLCGTGGSYQRGINDRALLHGHSLDFEVSVHRLKGQLGENVPY